MLAILAVTILFGTTTLAAQQRSQAIVAEQAQVSTTVSPDRLHFTCETKKFNQSQGITCYGPEAIRGAGAMVKLPPITRETQVQSVAFAALSSALKNTSR
jgi:hypothetical protein